MTVVVRFGAAERRRAGPRRRRPPAPRRRPTPPPRRRPRRPPRPRRADAVPRNLSGAATTWGTWVWCRGCRTSTQTSSSCRTAGRCPSRATTPASWRPSGAPAAWCRRLGPASPSTGATWIAAAITDADREAAAAGRDRGRGLPRCGSLVIDPDEYRAVLRRRLQRHAVVPAPRPVRPAPPAPLRPPLAGGVGRLPRRQRRLRRRSSPRRRPRARPCSCRTTTSRCSGERLAERPARPARRALPPHAVLRARRRCATLPDHVADELLRGLAGYRRLRLPLQPLGRTLRGVRARAARRAGPHVRRAGRRRPPSTSRRSRPATRAPQALAALDEAVGDRQLIVRVDRIELSKNLLRGFLAFDDLLRARPELARAGGVRRLRLPVPRGPARVPRLPPGGRGPRRPAQRSAGRTDDWTPILLDTVRRLPPLGRRPAAATTCCS